MDRPIPESRRFKLAIFDLDGTLTRERSAWEYLHRRLGLWEGKAEKYQEAFLRGEIDYSRFCQLDAAAWKGMKISAVREILGEIPLHEGAGDLVDYLKSRGVRIGVISSGLSLLADRLGEEFGFDFAVANELGSRDGILDGTIRIHVHYDRKAEWVEEAQKRFSAGKGETLAVGDSSGDLTLFQAAGFSIAFNSFSPRLEEAADLCIRSSDLRDLIPPLIPYLGPGGGKP